LEIGDGIDPGETMNNKRIMAPAADKSPTSDGAAAPDSESLRSRRSFLKASGLMAASGVATAGMLQSGAAAEPASHELTRPAAFDLAAQTPPVTAELPMNGATLFAKACKDEGLAALFCCPGNYTVTHAMAKIGIPVYTGRDERSMTHAADAFTRATGEVSATSGTEGPGFTNLLSGLANARAARTPILVLSSNKSVKEEDTEAAIQQMEQQSVTQHLVKWQKRLVRAHRNHEYAAYAFRQLKTGVPSAVHLDFTAEAGDGKVKKPTDIVYNFDKSRYRTDAKPNPSPAHVAQAIALLQKSSRPIVVASTGVFYSKAWDALRQFAEKTQIPVVESGAVRGQFPDDHPLSATCSPDALASADVVLLVGQYCMPSMGEYAFGPDARYIRIDPAAEDIGRNLPIEVGIVSDEKAALEVLYREAPAMRHDAWLSEIMVARKKFEAENEAIYTQVASYKDAVHPAVIAKDLADFLYRGTLPKEQTLVGSGGFGVARYTRRWLRAYRPGQILNGQYQFGTVGADVGYSVGAGVAVKEGVGVQAAYKGHPTITIMGDAAFGYSGMEMETLAKYRIPAIIIVYNNNAWGTWYLQEDEPRVVYMHLFQENIRYDKMAEALGAYGIYVTRPQDFLPALQRAYKTGVDTSMPTVINVQGKKEFWVREKYPPGFLGKIEPGVMSYYH
jgi:thiamine pyrophosphate-dependent acetolactate synthase large subunit-like protein